MTSTEEKLRRALQKLGIWNSFIIPCPQPLDGFSTQVEEIPVARHSFVTFGGISTLVIEDFSLFHLFCVAIVKLWPTLFEKPILLQTRGEESERRWIIAEQMEHVIWCLTTNSWWHCCLTLSKPSWNWGSMAFTLRGVSLLIACAKVDCSTHEFQCYLGSWLCPCSSL